MNDRFIRIEDAPDFVKDAETNALLNTNLDALAQHRQKRKQTMRIQNMEDEINMLKEELLKIKTHLNLS
jgi:hypothetical protein